MDCRRVPQFEVTSTYIYQLYKYGGCPKIGIPQINSNHTYIFMGYLFFSTKTLHFKMFKGEPHDELEPPRWLWDVPAVTPEVLEKQLAQQQSSAEAGGMRQGMLTGWW